MLKDNLPANIFLFVLIFLSPLEGSAQKVWTLDECIAYGLEHNLDLESGRIVSLQSLGEYQKSIMEYTPSMNSSGLITLTQEKRFEPEINISATLFDGMRRFNNTRSLKTLHQISEQEFLKTKNEVTISITRAYLELLLANELAKVAKLSYDNIREQYQRQKLLYEAGKLSYSSLLDMESQKSSELMELTNTINQQISQTVTLTQLMNFPYSEDFIISDLISHRDILPIERNIVDSIYTMAIGLPQIKSAELEVRKKRYDEKIAIGTILPTVSMDMSYNIRKDANIVGLTIRIPIFNKGYALYNIKQSTLEKNKYEIELKKKYQQLYKEIQMSVQDAISYYEEYQAALKLLEAAEEAFIYHQEKLEVGLITSIDYNYSKNKLVEARSRSIRAKYKYIFQLKVLDFYKSAGN